MDFDWDSLKVILTTTVATVGLKILAALAFWIVGRWLIGRITTSIKAAMNRSAVDPMLVKYLASVVGVRRYMEDPLSLIDIAIIGTRQLIALSVEHDVRILFTSTSEVYGRNPAVPWREEDDRVLQEGLPEIAGAVEFVLSLPAQLPTAVASSSTKQWVRTHLRHLGLDSFFGDRIFSGREDVARVSRPKRRVLPRWVPVAASLTLVLTITATVNVRSYIDLANEQKDNNDRKN